MSTLTIHPIEYLKLCLHLRKERRETKLGMSIRPGVGKILGSSETMATVFTVLFLFVLVTVTSMQLFEAGSFTAYYCDACTVLPTVLATP